MAQTFLTAEWRKLIMANYLVDQELLRPYLPVHTEFDCYGNDRCYLSLVGFLFQDVRLKGFRVPLHITFEEVNLRFYVHHTGDSKERKRGVVFIRELVPRAALSFVANTFYGEAYRTVRMRHKWTEVGDSLLVSYRWKQAGWHKLQVTAEKKAVPILAGSEEEFITEHYWGYTRLNERRTSEYEVVHPKWDVYPVKRYDIAVDFARVYGPQFGFLTGRAPDSIFLAEGSEVTVRSGAKIRLA